MHCAVLVFPGSNCDVDLYKAILQIKEATAEYVWHTDTDLDRFDVLLIPGGFTYGDYLRPGALAGVSPVIASVKKAANSGKLVLGICNGFQILIEAGLLPGALLPNQSLQFICDVVPVKVVQSRSPFTSSYELGDLLRLPIAHGSGIIIVTKPLIRNWSQTVKSHSPFHQKTILMVLSLESPVC